MDVVVVACAILLDVNACFGPCHPATPTTYSYLHIVYEYRGFEVLVTYNKHINIWLSKNTRSTREACEASTDSVLLLLIGLIR